METDKVYISTNEISCDGGPLGHPKIYLHVPEGQEIVCPYCSRIFAHGSAR